MVKIGMITIGQSPRNDILSVMKRYLPSDAQVVECGALDGLDRDEILDLAPDDEEVGTYSFTVTIEDSSSATADNTFFFEVYNVNDVPTINLPMLFEFDEDDSTSADGSDDAKSDTDDEESDDEFDEESGDGSDDDSDSETSVSTGIPNKPDESETQKAFDDASVEHLSDTEASEPFYGNIPTINSEPFIVERSLISEWLKNSREFLQNERLLDSYSKFKTDSKGVFRCKTNLPEDSTIRCFLPDTRVFR